MAHDRVATDCLALGDGLGGVTKRPEIVRIESTGPCGMEVQHVDECGAALHQTDPCVSAAVDLARVALGQAKEAFQIVVVFDPGAVLLTGCDRGFVGFFAHEQAGLPATHQGRHVDVRSNERDGVPGAERIEGGPAFGDGSARCVDGGRDLSQDLQVAEDLVALHGGGREAGVDAVLKLPQQGGLWTPLLAPTRRSIECEISVRARAMRTPGGSIAVPCPSTRTPRTAAV